MTGWGQDGPLAQRAGHDINYIALAGALHAIGRSGEAPVPPLNLVGDFGGGGMFLAFGVVCALLEAQRSPAGPGGRCRDGRRRRLPDGDDLRHARAAAPGATSAASTCSTPARPGTTPTRPSDGKWLADRRDRAQVLRRVHRAARARCSRDLPAQHDRSGWPELRAALRRRHSAAHARRMGAASSPAAMPAWRRCCRSPRSAITRTMPRVRPSSSAMASCSRHPHRAFRGRRAKSALRRDRAEPTARPSCVTGDSRLRRSMPCGQPAPSARPRQRNRRQRADAGRACSDLQVAVAWAANSPSLR